ncbi:hypothetical protein BDV33DRAFT_210738 [Aspergillus novoparasiticus]|uniref:Uncharacterized protein n=1 Tax=Aspergillus novoparasiticus TaxID=986946 RepID=A0A5N6E6K5_9EURO|nr:hypothetical protein BDV33DRAFT_210738 [Aspergillus novoparasiticus]
MTIECSAEQAIAQAKEQVFDTFNEYLHRYDKQKDILIKWFKDEIESMFSDETIGRLMSEYVQLHRSQEAQIAGQTTKASEAKGGQRVRKEGRPTRRKQVNDGQPEKSKPAEGTTATKKPAGKKPDTETKAARTTATKKPAGKKPATGTKARRTTATKKPARTKPLPTEEQSLGNTKPIEAEKPSSQEMEHQQSDEKGRPPGRHRGPESIVIP